MPGPLDGAEVPEGTVRLNHVVVEVLHPNTGATFSGGGGGVGGGPSAPMPDEFYVPDVLLRASDHRSKALYVDVNPVPNEQTSDLLYDAAAVFASIRNLILCPRGGRAPIFQEDYFCGVYDLLQEPFDGITATQLGIAVHQSLLGWEPRINVAPSDIDVRADPTLPGYHITISMTVNNTKITGVLSLPLS